MNWFMIIRARRSSAGSEPIYTAPGGQAASTIGERSSRELPRNCACGGTSWRRIVVPLLAVMVAGALCFAWPLEDAWAGTPRPHSHHIGIGSFSSSLFKFKNTQEDDGVGYGWQVAEPTLKFADGRQDPAQAWSCTLNIGMPLRTDKLGKISADWAAGTSATVATSSSSIVMRSKDSWTPAAFCKAFKDEMLKLFKKDHEGLGARVEVVGSG